MRACNGCRRRKIKCDAATTNTWPCSACARLKLVCVPPAIGQDGDASAEQGVEPDPTGSVGSASTIDPSRFPMPRSFRGADQPAVGSVPSYNDGMGTFPQFIHSPPDQQSFYGDLTPSHITPPHQPYQSQMFTAPQTQPLGASDGSLLVENEQSTAENLSEVLGELKIDETGIGTSTVPSEFNVADVEGQRHIFDNKEKVEQSRRFQCKTKRRRTYRL
jgi:hypothetical protein